MVSRVRFALSTLLGPWVVIAPISLVIGITLDRGAHWIGDPVWTVEWMSIPLFLVGPVVAGSVAVDTSRRLGASFEHLTMTSPSRTLIDIWIWGAGAVSLVHLAMLAIGLAAGLEPNPRVGWHVIGLMIASQILAIGFFGAVGSFVGRIVGPVTAGIAAAVVTFVLYLTLGPVNSSGSFRLLYFGGSTVSRVGMTWSVLYLVTQVLVLGLATAALLIVARYAESERWTRRRVAGLAGASLFTLTLIAAGWSEGPSQASDLIEDAPDRCALVEAAQVCTFREIGGMSDEVETRFANLFAAAQDTEYAVALPTRVEQQSWGYRPASSADRWTIWVERDIPPVEFEADQTLLATAWLPVDCDDAYYTEEMWNHYNKVEATWLGLMHPSEVDGYYSDPTPLSAEDLVRQMDALWSCSEPPTIKAAPTP